MHNDCNGVLVSLLCDEKLCKSMAPPFLFPCFVSKSCCRDCFDVCIRCVFLNVYVAVYIDHILDVFMRAIQCVHACVRGERTMNDEEQL